MYIFYGCKYSICILPLFISQANLRICRILGHPKKYIIGYGKKTHEGRNVESHMAKIVKICQGYLWYFLHCDGKTFNFSFLISSGENNLHVFLISASEVPDLATGFLLRVTTRLLAPPVVVRFSPPDRFFDSLVALRLATRFFATGIVLYNYHEIFLVPKLIFTWFLSIVLHSLFLIGPSLLPSPLYITF